MEIASAAPAVAGWPPSRLRVVPPPAAVQLERLRVGLPALDLGAVAFVATVAGAPGLMPILLAVAGSLALVRRGAYRERLRPTILDAAGDRAVAAAVAVATAAALHVYVEGAAPPALSLLAVLVVTMTAALVGVCAASVGLQRLAWRQGSRAPAVIVGVGRVADLVRRRLEDDLACGLRPVPGVADDVATLERLVARHGARHAIVGFSGQGDERMVAMVRACERLDIRVWVVPRLFDVLNHRATHETIGALPVLGLRSIARDDWRLTVKHALDRVVAALLLVIAAPLLAACALAVRLDSPGPVLFRQRRVGRDGREFQILKFRSMCPGAPTSAARLRVSAQTAPGGVEGEDRRTRVGTLLRRTSLDELPQLINVLRGEMSLVGPRPERPEFVTVFEQDLGRYGERHRMRAGITGWAQVHGLRGKTSIADRVAYDNHYIEHWSLGLDLKALVLTVAAVFRTAE